MKGRNESQTHVHTHLANIVQLLVEARGELNRRAAHFGYLFGTINGLLSGAQRVKVGLILLKGVNIPKVIKVTRCCDKLITDLDRERSVRTNRDATDRTKALTVVLQWLHEMSFTVHPRAAPV